MAERRRQGRRMSTPLTSPCSLTLLGAETSDTEALVRFRLSCLGGIWPSIMTASAWGSALVVRSMLASNRHVMRKVSRFRVHTFRRWNLVPMSFSVEAPYILHALPSQDVFDFLSQRPSQFTLRIASLDWKLEESQMLNTLQKWKSWPQTCANTTFLVKL